jgi:hypothetical protein
MPVPNTFGTATSAIPLSQLDDNFAAPITIGNTAVQLGNTVTTLNNMTLANVTISSGTITITNVSVTTANVSGTANVSTLVVVGNETVGGNTTVGGNVTLSGGTANGVAYLNTSKQITTGSALYFDGTNFGVGTNLPAYKLDVNGDIKVANAVRYFVGSTQYGVQFANAGAVGTEAYQGTYIYWGTGSGATATERMRLTDTILYTASTINVGIGLSNPSVKLETSTARTATVTSAIFGLTGTGAVNDFNKITLKVQNTLGGNTGGAGIGAVLEASASNKTGLSFYYDSGSGVQTDGMRLDSSGNLLVGATSSATSDSVAGVYLFSGGVVQSTRTSAASGDFGRLVDDGDIVVFRQAGTVEGSISVSGTTVSYNGGHLSRWAQTTAPKDNALVKGTVLSNLDEMNSYTDAEGNPVANEQLNKVKVSDVEGDANVAGVFVNWTYDEQHSVDEINMAMTGDMIIRIAQGTTVQRGDLLMSAGDGTAKPQGDDIVRSKTVAKVTSTHVTCAYSDGSYCVPCVLMAC